MKRIIFSIIIVLVFSSCESKQCNKECCNESLSNNLTYLIQSRDELQVQLHNHYKEFDRLVIEHNNVFKLNNEKYIDSVNLYEPGSTKYNYYDSIVTSLVIKNNAILDYYYDSLIFKTNIAINCIDNKLFKLNNKINQK